MTLPTQDQAISDLRLAGRYLFDNNLAWGNAGNLSARIHGDAFIITASGTSLGNLGQDDFAVVPLEGPSPLAGRRPSKEVPMHRAVYAVRPEINAVLHAAPFYSTLAACTRLDLPDNLFVEDMYYLERVARVPYFHPGSAALGEAVRQQARLANVLLLENHGVLVSDESVKEALMGVHVMEIVARMAVTARSAGLDMQPLSQEMVHDFLENSGYRPRRQWPSSGEGLT